MLEPEGTLKTTQANPLALEMRKVRSQTHGFCCSILCTFHSPYYFPSLIINKIWPKMFTAFSDSV